MTERIRSVSLRRSLLTATAIGLLCAAAALAVPAGASDQPPRQSADPPRWRAAPPIPAVESVRTLANGPRYETAPDGTVYSPLDEPAFIGGHDNGQSTLYDNGEGLRFSFWSFGDTFLTQPNGDGDGFLANTGALTTDFDLSNSISDWWYDGGDGGPREFIGLTADEQAWNDQHKDTDPNVDGCQPGAGVEWMDCGNELAIWGGSIVADPDQKRILAFYGLIERVHVLKDGCTQDDIDNQNEACRELSFDGRAHGVAVWTEESSDGTGWTRQLVENPADPDSPYSIWPYDEDPGTADLVFDKGMVTDGGFLYAYGCPGQFTSECRVARAPLAGKGVWDRAAWRFYAGPDHDPADCPRRWSDDVSCAIALPAGKNPDGTPATLTGGAAGTSVFWNPHFELFMSIYSVPLSNDIHYRVANRPEGPWSRAELLGTALPAAGSGLGSISYAGFAHPEYAEQNGKVQYLTYAHTTADFRSDFPVVKVTFTDGIR